MSRNAFAQLVSDQNRDESDRAEAARERAEVAAMPTWDSLRQRVAELEAERDEWRDAYMELRKLTGEQT